MRLCFTNVFVETVTVTNSGFYAINVTPLMHFISNILTHSPFVFEIFTCSRLVEILKSVSRHLVRQNQWFYRTGQCLAEPDKCNLYSEEKMMHHNAF
jgi:hypothetical protein